MKSNKGITLVSVMLYIIVLSMVIGTVSTLTKYFYNDSDETILSNNTSEQHTRFLTYLADTINSGRVEQVNLSMENKCINLKLNNNNIHRYVFKNNKIYFVVTNKSGQNEKIIKLCSNIENCSFSYSSNKLKTAITIKGITYNNNFSI